MTSEPTPDPSAPRGVLPIQQIEDLIETGAIAATPGIEPDQLQPASLDLRLGKVAYRIRASFLTGPDGSVADRLSRFAMHRMDLTQGAVLEKGCVYLVPLLERLDLPAEIFAAANAKSSTGRLDLLTRLITDRGAEFDRVAPGYRGPLWAEICPRSFSVLVRHGMRLNQIRFRDGPSALDTGALNALQESAGLVDGTAHIDDGLGFSVDLKPRQDGVVGYRAKPHAGVVDLDCIDAYAPEEFWDAVPSEAGGLILDPGAFYILVSRESVHIPPDCAAEMAPYMALVGEFRVHYAGFFDPGFGHGPAGGAGARAVLEVRCHEAPFFLQHGQRVGRLVYERMKARPHRLYGADSASNYQGQGLKLSKHFKSP